MPGLQEHGLPHREGKIFRGFKLMTFKTELWNMKVCMDRFRWMEPRTTRAASNAAMEGVWLAPPTTSHTKAVSTASTTIFNSSKRKATWASWRVKTRIQCSCTYYLKLENHIYIFLLCGCVFIFYVSWEWAGASENGGNCGVVYDGFFCKVWMLKINIFCIRMICTHIIRIELISS